MLVPAFYQELPLLALTLYLVLGPDLHDTLALHFPPLLEAPADFRIRDSALDSAPKVERLQTGLPCKRHVHMSFSSLTGDMFSSRVLCTR